MRYRKTLRCVSLLKLLMLVSVLLSGCVSNSLINAEKRNIYQTSVLVIPAGTEIPQIDGAVYTTQSDEIWYSYGAYQTLQRQLLEALTKEK